MATITLKLQPKEAATGYTAEELEKLPSTSYMAIQRYVHLLLNVLLSKYSVVHTDSSIMISDAPPEWLASNRMDLDSGSLKASGKASGKPSDKASV